MRSRLLLGVFVFILALTASLGSAQSSQPPAVINTALADLSTRLGQTISLTDLAAFTFQEQTFPDATLGCTIVSTNGNTATNIDGFSFALTFQGVTYDYRVSADNTIVVPCDAGLMQMTPGAPTAIPTVNATPVACPDNFSGFLAPRLNIGMQGRVVASSASHLRSTPSLNAAEISLLNAGATFIVNGGPSCAEGFVWWQVSVNGQIGWLAEGQLPSTYFLEPIIVQPTLLPITPVAATTTQITVQPPSGTLPNLAAAPDASIHFYTLNADGSVTDQATVNLPPLGDYDSLQSSTWSLDGQHFAFIIFRQDLQTSTQSHDLYLTDASGATPVLLAQNVDDSLPVAFTPDSSAVIYGRAPSNQATPEVGGSSIEIVSQPPQANSTATTLGTIQFNLGCGGGSDSAAHARYEGETGYQGSGAVLKQTPAGIVYSTACTGSGTSLLNLQTGQSTPIGTNLSRVRFSPDLTQLVGIEDSPSGSGTLAVVNLATGQATPITTSVAPEQVVWGYDNHLYFSATNTNGVNIFRIGVDGSGETQVYSGAGTHIGRMLPAPDGTLFFSVVPTDQAWNDALTAGTTTQSATLRQRLSFVPVTFFGITPTGTVVQYQGNLAQAALNTASFVGTAG